MACRERVVDLLRDERLRYVLVYRNQGRIAGAVLPEHAHTVLLALPVVPRVIQEELAGARRHYELKERCVYCDILEQELRDGKRVVAESEHFLAMAPFAARLPFETWIVPRRHGSRFIDVSDAALADLAALFKGVMSGLDAALDRPPYNYVIHAAPRGVEADDYYHWHIEILPRLTSLSGFELGGEMYINVTPPEEAAAFLKTCIKQKE
ncbi:MAG: Galactose-1-phosphate uridylyltransferase [Deltaproteobacteria bacterium ADurb.Bin510]|nr:MAG: Galactose-1-phosphate uridylyltransferase [Deltaproteobacteria bacterium ADurb.Bin510]